MRANKQCLVESLGNREYHVYMDDGKKIYQGADASILLQRLDKMSVSLSEIPGFVGEKKWRKVTGILTAPMGSLGK